MLIEIQNTGSYELYEKISRSIIGPQMAEQTFIDLCCCEATVTRRYEFREKTYVDVLDCWHIPGQMHRFVQADVLGEHEIFDKQYNIAYCSDGIEHLLKEDGFRLIEKMEKISSKQILFTPLGEYLVDASNPDPKGHKSGWHPNDFPGFAAIVAPNYHPTLNIGAFWVWKCQDIEADFERVSQHLHNDYEIISF
jgi:hypothetical protein